VSRTVIVILIYHRHKPTDLTEIADLLKRFYQSVHGIIYKKYHSSTNAIITVLLNNISCTMTYIFRIFNNET
jgi:hypothetical protein